MEKISEREFFTQKKLLKEPAYLIPIKIIKDGLSIDWGVYLDIMELHFGKKTASLQKT